MRIQLEVSGGFAYFPGLNQPVIIDSNTSPKAQVEKVNHLLEEVHFFELPPSLHTAPPGAADYRQYTITVDDGIRHHVVQATDPIKNPGLQALINFLLEQNR